MWEIKARLGRRASACKAHVTKFQSTQGRVLEENLPMRRILRWEEMARSLVPPLYSVIGEDLPGESMALKWNVKGKENKAEFKKFYHSPQTTKIWSINITKRKIFVKKLMTFYWVFILLILCKDLLKWRDTSFSHIEN